MLLATGAVALAAFEEGSYEGATEQSAAVTFRVINGKVKRIEATAYADCDDGSRERIVVARGRTLLEQNRFALSLRGDAGLKVVIAGKLQDAAAVGRLKARVKPRGTNCAVKTRWEAATA